MIERLKYAALRSAVISICTIDYKGEIPEKLDELLNRSEEWRTSIIYKAASQEQVKLDIVDAIGVLLEVDYNFRVEVLVACSLAAGADEIISPKEGIRLTTFAKILNVNFDDVKTKLNQILK